MNSVTHIKQRVMQISRSVSKQVRQAMQTSSCSSLIRSSSTTASSHCVSSCRTRLNDHSASTYFYNVSAHVTSCNVLQNQHCWDKTADMNAAAATDLLYRS